MEQEFYQRALERLKAGDRDGAIRAFDRALRVNPEFAEAYYRRGGVRFDLADWQGAIADYTQALQLQPTAEAYLGRALVQLAIGETQAAILDVTQALQQNPESAAAHRVLGAAYRKLGNAERSIAAYKQAAKQYIAQKDKANGQQCLEAIAQLQAIQARSQQQSQTGFAIVQAESFLQQATQKIKQGNYRSALDDLDWLIQIDAQDAEAYCQRGLVRLKLGNARGAIQDLGQALRLNPQNQQAWLNRGMIRLELKDALGAIDDFNQVLRSVPNHADAYVQRGHAYHQLQNQRQAIADYTQALNLKPDDPELHCICAAARREFGDLPGAVQDYQRAANLWMNQGNWAKYQQTLEQIKALQANPRQPIDFANRAGGSPDADRQTELHNQLLRIVGGARELAERLLDIARQRHPGMSEEWYLKKVIFDLENQ